MIIYLILSLLCSISLYTKTYVNTEKKISLQHSKSSDNFSEEPEREYETEYCILNYYNFLSAFYHLKNFLPTSYHVKALQISFHQFSIPPPVS